MFKPRFPFGGLMAKTDSLSRLEEHDRKLAQLEQEHSLAQEALKRHSESLMHRQKVLEAKAAVIAQLDEELSRRQSELKSRREKLDSEASEVGTLESEVSSRKKSLESLEARVAGKEKAFRLEEKEYETKGRHLTALKENFEKTSALLTSKLTRLQEELSDKRHRLAGLEKSAAEAEARIKSAK